MDLTAKNYELAYLLSPLLDDQTAGSEASRLGALAEQSGGMVNRADPPRRRELAYPVKKHGTAYFGWISFSMRPESLAGLNERLSANPNILRSLVSEEEIEKRKPIMLRSIPPQRGLARPGVPAPREKEQAGEELDLEALDKKLDEILGK